MLDPYDPPHPDGADDEDDLPGATLASVPWFDDEDEGDDERSSDFRPHLEDPA